MRFFPGSSRTILFVPQIAIFFLRQPKKTCRNQRRCQLRVCPITNTVKDNLPRTPNPSERIGLVLPASYGSPGGTRSGPPRTYRNLVTNSQSSLGGAGPRSERQRGSIGANVLERAVSQWRGGLSRRIRPRRHPPSRSHPAPLDQNRQSPGDNPFQSGNNISDHPATAYIRGPTSNPRGIDY